MLVSNSGGRAAAGVMSEERIENVWFRYCTDANALLQKTCTWDIHALTDDEDDAGRGENDIDERRQQR